jgi:lysozyme family protein
VKSNYENCLAITLKWEGGDVNNPADPGGKTRWGVTQATYNAFRKSHHLAAKSVFTMEKPEMLAIYKENYWDAVGGDSLSVGLDLATWDFGVNSGPGRAKSALAAVRGKGDGTMVNLIQRLCAKRMSFVRGLSTFKTFGKGWSRRVADIEARAVKMTLTAQTPVGSVKPALQAEANKAASQAASSQNKAAGSGAGALFATPGAGHWIGLALLAVALAAGAYFIWRAAHNQERARAYAQVASEG